MSKRSTAVKLHMNADKLSKAVLTARKMLDVRGGGWGLDKIETSRDKL
jgi:hypothetical protein